MNPTAEVYYNQARELFYNKNYDDALKIAEKAITFENNNLSCWMLVTEIYIALNQFQNASSSILTVLNFSPNCPHAWHLRARVLLGLMRYNEALIASDKSLNLDKNNSEFQKFNENVRHFIKVSTKEQEKEINNAPYVSNEHNNVHDNSSNNQNNSSSNNQDEPKIEDYEFGPLNEYNNIYRIISSKNLKLFKEKKFNSKIYYSMLDNIMKDAIKNVKIDSNLRIYNKLLNLASFFAEINYKSEGEEDGLYSCNVIQIDNRRRTIQQITTIIHELTHHLLSEILELSLMYLFDSVKTDAIESFAWYALNFKDENRLMNEYCAHCVENYFMPVNYENFASFNRVLENFDLNNPKDLEKINHATTLGNTFSQDIIYMLNKFIDDNLKKEIKKQYVLDGFLLYTFEGTKFKTNSFFDDETKFNLINSLFSETIIHVKTHFGILELLNYKKEFNKVNNRR